MQSDLYRKLKEYESNLSQVLFFKNLGEPMTDKLIYEWIVTLNKEEDKNE